MTAPDGAFEIGGGEYNYGQDYNETLIDSMFRVPSPSVGDARDALRAALGMVPKESLRGWQSFIGGDDEEYESQDAAIDFIVDNTLDKPEGGLRGLIDNLVHGLSGWTDTLGWPAPQVKQSAKELAENVADMTAFIQELQARKGAGQFSGNSALVNFSLQSDSSSLGSDWTQDYAGSGSGTYGVEDGRAQWDGDANNRWMVALYDVPTKTDYQKVGAVWATKPSRGLLGGNESVNRLMARMSSDGGTFVGVNFTADSFTLGYSVSGSWTTLQSVSFKFKPGAAYWLECGTSGGVRIFRVWENDKALLAYTETGSGSQYGASYRNVGMAVMCYGTFYKPAQTASWAFFDNTPPTLRGCGWLYTRTSGSSDSLDNGSNLMPGSWYDTPGYITNDLAYSSSTNRITVSADGWYLVNIVQAVVTSISIGSGKTAAGLWRNGTKVQQGGYTRSDTTSDFMGFAGSFIVYCEAGDYLQPGYVTNWPGSSNSLLEGEASGRESYWSGTFLGNTRPLN